MNTNSNATSQLPNGDVQDDDSLDTSPNPASATGQPISVDNAEETHNTKASASRKRKPKPVAAGKRSCFHVDFIPLDVQQLLSKSKSRKSPSLSKIRTHLRLAGQLRQRVKAKARRRQLVWFIFRCIIIHLLTSSSPDDDPSADVSNPFPIDSSQSYPSTNPSVVFLSFFSRRRGQATAYHRWFIHSTFCLLASNI